MKPGSTRPARSRHTLPVRGPLDLPLTFTCGQAFRWVQDGDAWSGVIGGAEVRLAGPVRSGARGGVRARAAVAVEAEVRGDDPGRGALRRYLRLEEDPAVHLRHAEELRTVPGLVPLLGLRLLRQDPWETLASFICSAAANIRKITRCVEGLADTFGKPIDGSRRRSFPTPEAIARGRESDLRALGMGFRAPYLLATARAIAGDADWSWRRMRTAPLEEARSKLIALPGVGRKIADCVLLFGLDRLEAYPVDRWIRRATLELSARSRARDDELARWAVRLGPGRGYLQQILFHLRRTSGPLPALPAMNGGTRSVSRRPSARRTAGGR